MERGITMMAAGFAAMAMASAALAADDAARPVTDRRPTVESAVTTPAQDLNLKKTPIPEALQKATANPYELAGLDNCDAIAAEVVNLDAALGADRDAPPAADDGKGSTVATVLQTGVQAIIPYRGVVRELSGANKRERTLQESIQIGFARRGFLKGKAVEMNCPAGASPAGFTPVPKLAAAPIDVPPAVAPAAPVDLPAPPAEGLTSTLAADAPAAQPVELAPPGPPA